MTEELQSCVSDVVGRVEVCQKSSRYLTTKAHFKGLLEIECKSTPTTSRRSHYLYLLVLVC